MQNSPVITYAAEIVEAMGWTALTQPNLAAGMEVSVRTVARLGPFREVHAHVEALVLAAPMSYPRAWLGLTSRRATIEKVIKIVKEASTCTD